ncbi:hypothetical protein FALCPG4_012797 [Fusarium falciforme]
MVWMLPTVVMAVPPSDNLASCNWDTRDSRLASTRTIPRWARDAAFGMSLLDFRASTHAQRLGLGLWLLVAFSAKGLPAESPSPRDSGQTTQDPVVLQPRRRSTMPMHPCLLDMGVFWPQTRLSSHLELKLPP